MDSPQEVKIPTGTVFTLIVPLDRENKEKATFYLKDISEDVFLAARTLMNKDRDFEAVRLIIKALWVGGEPPERLNGNFVASQSARKLIGELLEPVEGELKKN